MAEKHRNGMFVVGPVTLHRLRRMLRRPPSTHCLGSGVCRRPCNHLDRPGREEGRRRASPHRGPWRHFSQRGRARNLET